MRIMATTFLDAVVDTRGAVDARLAPSGPPQKASSMI
jgi:hypothetical protein